MAQALIVTDRDGRQGVLAEPPTADRVALRVEGGEALEIPAELLAAQADGSYRLPLAFSDLLAGGGAARARIVLPVAEERLHVSARLRETGRTRLTRRVEQTDEVIETDLVREEVEIVRVPVGRFVDAAEPLREESGVTIIPVYEEVLVVEKRLRLVEEVHVVRHRTEERVQERTTLRRAHVDVEQVGPDGRPASPQEPSA